MRGDHDVLLWFSDIITNGEKHTKVVLIPDVIDDITLVNNASILQM